MHFSRTSCVLGREGESVTKVGHTSPPSGGFYSRPRLPGGEKPGKGEVTVKRTLTLTPAS